MPELPEVEVVRAGLAETITGATVTAVSVLDGRALKRHGATGATHAKTLTKNEQQFRTQDFKQQLLGQTLTVPVRRGKFMWLPIKTRKTTDGYALLAHLGMSGQLLIGRPGKAQPRHLRVRIELTPKRPTLKNRALTATQTGQILLDFADQRLFGSLAVDKMVATPDGHAGGYAGHSIAAGPWKENQGSLPQIPVQALNIARDPLDPHFMPASWQNTIQASSRPIKTLLLDQAIMSGIGNIYADETLWMAKTHPLTPGGTLTARKLDTILKCVREVLERALAEGGTSFDSLYVNVKGESGYFAHSLNAYGCTGQPCNRCGQTIRRITVAARSTHYCPKCQRRR